MLIPLLRQAIEKRLIRLLDLHFALTLVDESQPALLLAVACLSAHTGEGHVCLPLSQLKVSALFDGRHPELADAIWQAAEQPDDWQTLLGNSDVVGDGTLATPVVLYQQRLYLHRMWCNEGKVARFIAVQSDVPMEEVSHARAVLDQLFGHQPDDWQKIAAAVALTSKISVISGGPGTGKTTTVAKLLAALIRLSPGALRIQLAAPTGKAAVRMTASLSSVLPGLALSHEDRRTFPVEATTLHRLLGAQPDSQRMRYHGANPLHLDVLVIDEASMVDLPMMASLIAALPAHARVIFLGDRDQLASVEAGAVLGDICHSAVKGYSLERARLLSQLTGCQVAGQHSEEASVVRNSICLLRKSYRFNSTSGIGQLAQAVNAGDCRQADALLDADFDDIARHPLGSADDYQQLLEQCVTGYRPYLQRVQQQVSAHEVIATFHRYQLLCALRDGPYGVEGLNHRIERILHQQGLIQRSSSGSGKWYAGRPVMIARNDRALGLYNGDTGIALHDDEGSLKVFFPLASGAIKAVHPSRLPPHDTAYAMTVHKSQGSEFEHTTLVLPDHALPVLTRELVYTAISRAREKLTLFADRRVWQQAVTERTRRRSGLKERLLQVDD